MNKSDMIETVQAVLADRKQAEAAVNSIISNISDALKKRGYGTPYRFRYL